MIVVALVIAFVPFLRTLHPRDAHASDHGGRRSIVGGALVMELPLGWWTAHHGMDSFGYALIDWVEETMEMVGARSPSRPCSRIARRPP